MIHTNKIMVPVDFSEASKKAVNYGLSLALEFNACLILAHITPYPKLTDERARLLDLIPPDCRDALNFESVVQSGEVRHEILEIVKDKEVDLVVMGTHGRPYFERLLLGSVTERMLRKLHIPVLTVSHLDPEKEIHKPAAVPFDRILYATDLTEGSQAGLELSVRLARGLDAQLTVAHVLEHMTGIFHGIETAGYTPEAAAEMRARAEERLSRSVASVSDGKVPITTVMGEGVPYETINRLATELKADLIIINLQGTGMLERALLGSTAERVIRTATVPVLSLPMPAIYASRWTAA
jgi:nucleotide-binding universal stress UspA family protein